jgi:hypothetical protein
LEAARDENAFRATWGFHNKSRRAMTIISKSAFRLSDQQFDSTIKSELDAGRPVMYMAQEAKQNIGHAFIIAGYRSSDGKVHINFGWGGYGNGYYSSATLTDPSGRSWNREPMIYLGLESESGYAALMAPASATAPNYSWNGTGSIISFSSGNKIGYGLDKDEAAIHSSSSSAVVFFQWEIDSRDGHKLVIDAKGMKTATIRYGVWSHRSQDIMKKNVSLPYTIDPKKDNVSYADGEYYVISVSFEKAPAKSIAVTANSMK